MVLAGINSILERFTVNTVKCKSKPFGNGHINDTYLIDGLKEKYILQKINHHVFPDPQLLMNNLSIVTEHIINKQPEEKNIIFYSAVDGKNYVRPDDGSYWRLMNYIDNTVSYDVVSNPETAYQGGKAFGHFQRILSDLPLDGIGEVIQDFHHMGKRLEQYQEALSLDPLKRVKKIPDLLEFVEVRKDEMLLLSQLREDGTLKDRVTHNDTKINNVLMDKKNGKAVCVIDLDTVMPGLVHYDFGDAVRTATNTGKEDDENLDAVAIQMELYEALTDGYLSEAAHFLHNKEAEYLPLSAKTMVFIIGLRFLTDYINGDIYYKTKSEDHNKQRALAQFKLLSSIELHFQELLDITEKIFFKYKRNQ